MSTNRNVLVTGYAGFLGSHIALHHLYMGDVVMGVDNHSTSARDSKHVSSIKRMMSNGILGTSHECCIADTAAFARAADIHWAKYRRRFNLIYNFACPASPPMYRQLQLETLDACYLGTKNVLGIATDHKSIVVHASTSEVYGDPSVSPQSECYWGNVNPRGERSMYDEGKRVAEALCSSYQRKHSVDARTIRIFNTYGPHMHQDDGRVVTNFIKQALLDEPLTVYGAGSQTRSFCYVDDLLRGIIAVANSTTNPVSPVNLGNPHEITVLELANKVLRAIPRSQSSIKFQALPPDDPMQRKPDISLAKKLYKWEPTVSVDDGIKLMVEHYESQQRDPDRSRVAGKD